MPTEEAQRRRERILLCWVVVLATIGFFGVVLVLNTKSYIV